jgi:CheY-like chemotaxis protein
LIGDIEYVFKNRLDFISSESIGWVREYLHSHNVKLVIADMDMKIAGQTEVLDGIREFETESTSLLFLVSEKKKLELERNFGDLRQFDISADWLIKPFSRNALVSSVDRICG